MRHITLVLFGFAAIGLASCENTSYVYKPGVPVTLAEKDTDLFNCRLEAVNSVPVNNLTYSTPGYTTPVNCTTNYGGYISCTGGNTFGGGIHTVDVNAGLRNQVEDRCRAAKGYIITTIALPKCTPEQIPAGFPQPSSKVKTPVEGACFLSASKNATLILLPEEQQ